MALAQIEKQSSTTTILWTLIYAAMLALTLGQAVPPVISPAGRVEAAGDGDSLWIAAPGDAGSLRVLHRSGHADSAVLHLSRKLNGQLVPHGLAASHEQVWLVYSDQKVKSIEFVPPVGAEGPLYPDRTDVPLPEGVSLRCIAARGDDLWALVRVETADALHRIDASSPSYNGEDEGDQPVEVPEASDVEPHDSSTPNWVPYAAVDRLLHRTRRGWSVVALPDIRSGGELVYLVFHPQRSTPDLVVVVGASPEKIQHYYQPGGSDWQKTDHDLKNRGRVEAAMVGQHLVVAQQISEAASIQLRVILLRAGELHELGQITVGQPAEAWTLVDAGGLDRIGVLTWDDQRQFFLTQMDWSGNVTATAPLEIRRVTPWPAGINQTLLIFAVLIATLMMFLFWRRDESRIRPELPKPLVPADLARRAAAAVIDLSPAVLVTVVGLDVSPGELASLWPGHYLGAMADMAPWFFCAGVFVGHSMVTELFTARTLGKALVGLRVTDMRGNPPHLWQVLARNGMKILELIVFPLLVLPALAPYGNRLGDMAARTIVVMEVIEEKGSNSDPDEQ